MGDKGLGVGAHNHTSEPKRELRTPFSPVAFLLARRRIALQNHHRYQIETFELLTQFQASILTRVVLLGPIVTVFVILKNRFSKDQSGFSGIEVTYSDSIENISVVLAARSGTVFLSPMLMQFWEPMWSELTVRKEDGKGKDLIMEGRLEVINFALQSIQYIGNENFYSNDALRVSTLNKNGVNNLDIPVIVKPMNDPPFIDVPSFIVLEQKNHGEGLLIFDRKIMVEENKVESIKRDKAETESLLQETIENHQAELAAQKEFYTNALNTAKEAEALAESRANDEARTELESHLREAGERENMLAQDLEELRQTLSRKEQESVFREDMLRREVEDLQKWYQASERRCEELVTQVPESTRPLLRHIEAIQETTARRAEAWAAVERSLNSRLQVAEARATSVEERERSINERLSQTLSRVNVLEAQISCLRAETQLSRSLEKE